MTGAALTAKMVEPGETAVLTMGSREAGASDLMKIHRV